MIWRIQNRAYNYDKSSLSSHQRARSRRRLPSPSLPESSFTKSSQLLSQILYTIPDVFIPNRSMKDRRSQSSATILLPEFLYYVIILFYLFLHAFHFSFANVALPQGNGYLLLRNSILLVYSCLKQIQFYNLFSMKILHFKYWTFIFY